MLLDSNIIVAFFNEKDTLNNKASIVLQAIDKWIIPQQILFEAITVLELRTDKGLAKRALLTLISDEKVEVIEAHQDDIEKCYHLFLNQKGSLTLYDMLLFAVSKSEEIPFLSFDKKLNAFKP